MLGDNLIKTKYSHTCYCIFFLVFWYLPIVCVNQNFVIFKEFIDLYKIYNISVAEMFSGHLTANENVQFHHNTQGKFKN